MGLTYVSTQMIEKPVVFTELSATNLLTQKLTADNAFIKNISLQQVTANDVFFQGTVITNFTATNIWAITIVHNLPFPVNIYSNAGAGGTNSTYSFNSPNPNLGYIFISYASN